MDHTRLKNAVLEIHMPEDMKKRLLEGAVSGSSWQASRSASANTKSAAYRNHAAAGTKSAASKNSATVSAEPSTSTDRSPARAKSAASWAKPAAAVLAVVLCLTLTLPVLAAAVPSVYDLIYRISPATAQFFQPVQKSATDNGIKMEVASAYIHGDTAEICITMQDLTGGRIDGTTDLYDSYDIHTPFDSTARCERIGYDPATGAVTFLVTITQTGSKDIAGDKITFSVGRFLSHKMEYSDIAIPIDLTAIPETAETREVSLTGFFSKDCEDMPDTFPAMLPGEPDEAFEVEGIDLTGIAYIDDSLHIQTAVKDSLSNDNHGYFYLVDAAGNTLHADAGCSFIDEASGVRTSYTESVFSISREKLADCTLHGSFTISGMLTEGNWKVTFPLEHDGEK